MLKLEIPNRMTVSVERYTKTELVMEIREHGIALAHIILDQDQVRELANRLLTVKDSLQNTRKRFFQ